MVEPSFTVDRNAVSGAVECDLFEDRAQDLDDLLNAGQRSAASAEFDSRDGRELTHR